jgi:putative glutamine amidotransferase
LVDINIMKPIIAITTYGRYEKDLANAYYQDHISLPSLYIDAVRRAGGVPFLLPPGEEDLETVLARVDGVLITGGADVNPAEYRGNIQHPQLTSIDTERDKSELALVHHLLNGNKLPTLCICHSTSTWPISTPRTYTGVTVVAGQYRKSMSPRRHGWPR